MKNENVLLYTVSNMDLLAEIGKINSSKND